MMNNWVSRYGNNVNYVPMSRGVDGSWAAMGSYGAYLHLAFSIITWILVIAILVAVLRWLWKKGGK